MSRSAFFALAWLCAAADALGQERLLHFGAKAAAMGGAFTALADDATAFYWNPAGYSFGPVFAAGFSRGEANTDRGGGRSFSDEASGFAIGLTFLGASGTLSRASSSRQEGDVLSSRGLRTFDLALSILQSLPLDDLVVATNVHYLRGEGHERSEAFAELNPEDRRPEAIRERVFDSPGMSRSTASLDVSALYQASPWLRLGIMGRRLFEPEFETPSGEVIVLPRHTRAGVAVLLPREGVVSFDFDISRQGENGEAFREISLGGEKRFFERALSLRAGVRAETGSGLGARPSFSFGVGARVRFVLLEAAYIGSPQDRDEALWFAVTVSP